ncbi:hypothetical protein, partial [Paraburkholderia caledonica]|uniref:hypothetical protein n=1 Tax=Paraburkholderia caledonica TaxID=134536 RepID=UPI001ABAE843
VFDDRSLESRAVPAHEKTPQIVGRVSNFWGAVHRAVFFAPFFPGPQARVAVRLRARRSDRPAAFAF